MLTRIFIISCSFDRVFDGTSTQTDLFKQVEPFVDKIFHGVNGTIFAYGQTGSGKTHTMMGNTFANGGDGGGEGLIPQSINHIFRRITSQQQQNQESLKFKVFASYIEIYNDKIFDLLVEERTVSGLDIRETFEKNIIVAGLTEVELTCVQDFCKYQNIAISHRSIGATKLNDRSSRSHFIMQIKIESISSSTRSSTSTLSGKLHLIDLAGSEDNKRTGNSGARMIESGAINKSLFDLGQVVESLNKNLPRIPYRNSKITRFLQDSLGGSAMGLMIACIAPGESNLQDTIGTLNFALKAKGVKNVIQVNEQAGKKKRLKKKRVSGSQHL